MGLCKCKRITLDGNYLLVILMSKFGKKVRMAVSKNKVLDYGKMLNNSIITLLAL